jgi:murein lipoprotein
MEKVINLSMFVLSISLIAGCATPSDIEKLQSQVDDLNTSVALASADATSAQKTAADAAAKAESVAKNYQIAIRKLNKKIKRFSDKKIKRSMME